MTPSELISEAAANIEGVVPQDQLLSNIKNASIHLLDMLLDNFDYDSNRKTDRAVIARVVASMVAQCEIGIH